MTKKRRHHYIPKFYLEGFVDPTNEPYIWIYEKGNPAIRKATSENIAVQKDYYSFIGFNGKKDSETFENALAEVESKIALAYRKIIKREKLSDEDKGAFATFLALNLTRVPNFRENIQKATGEILKALSAISASNPASFESFIKNFEKDTGEKIYMPIDNLRRFLLNGKYNVIVDPQHSLEMIPVAGDIALIFLDMKWAFLEATEGHRFLTSDNPVFRVVPTYRPGLFSRMGLLNKDIEVTFPISKDLGFLGTWDKCEGYQKVDNNYLKEINRRTIISALRFVFSSEKSDKTNELVQQYKDSAPQIKVE